MKNAAIFYASTTGNTERIAELISEKLDNIKKYNLKVTGTDFILDYNNIILGISTWSNGSLQEDWAKIWKDFCKVDFTGKNVSIFGLGNQIKYKENFADAMLTIYNQVVLAGGNIIGFTSLEEYNYKIKESKAIINEKFIGLVLDLENENNLTSPRIEKWIEDLKKSFK